MKKLFIISLLLFICSMGLALDLNKHHKIFIGWIDFNSNDYKKYGYEDKCDWNTVSTFVNKEIFQRDLSAYLYDYYYTNSATSITDVITTYTWYYLKISDVKLSSDFRKLSVMISIIDIDDNVLEYRFPITVVISDGVQPVEKENGLMYLCGELAFKIYYKIISGDLK